MKCIIEIIDRAFDGVLYPGRANVCASKSGEWEFEPLFNCEDQWCQDWRKVPEELIAKEIRGIIPLFSADGYRFFIPAYMKTALMAIEKPFDDDYATLLMFVVYSLCPSEEFEEHRNAQMSKLNVEQANAIRAFLQYVRIHDPDKEFDKLIASVFEKNLYGVRSCPCLTSVRLPENAEQNAGE